MSLNAAEAERFTLAFAGKYPSPIYENLRVLVLHGDATPEFLAWLDKPEQEAVRNTVEAFIRNDPLFTDALKGTPPDGPVQKFDRQ